MRVSEFMTTNVVTVSSKTALFEARKFIVAHNIRRLPVVDRGKLVGIAFFPHHPQRMGDERMVKQSDGRRTDEEEPDNGHSEYYS